MKANEILKEGYIAFEVDKKSRNELKKQFPPKYADFIGHHITYKFGVPKDSGLPKNVTGGTVVGYVDDGDSLEALVVELKGTTTRPDGKIYHITWSLDKSKGRKPVESNNLLKNTQWTKVNPIAIKVKAAMFG